MNNQLSREALIIYLGNLRTLEYIKHGCNKSIQNIKEKEERIEHEIVRMKNTEFRYPNEPVFMDSILVFSISLAVITVIVEILGNIFFGIIDTLSDVKETFRPVSDINPDPANIGNDLDIIVGIIILIIAAIIFVIGIIKIFVKYKKKKTVYIHQKNQVENDFHQHINNLKKTEEKLNRFKIEKQKYIQEINRYKYKINDMLYDSYSLNIVPMQFRDIYGVTYLYDFISTSNLSLSDAVLNCNMDQIKSKLDIIIQKCNFIIEGLQSVNANLNEIQRQNDKLLKESRNISYNTALAAQYSEIAATNSAVSLELQKKQLAYQKVDFWRG